LAAHPAIAVRMNCDSTDGLGGTVVTARRSQSSQGVPLLLTPPLQVRQLKSKSLASSLPEEIQLLNATSPSKTAQDESLASSPTRRLAPPPGIGEATKEFYTQTCCATRIDADPPPSPALPNPLRLSEFYTRTSAEQPSPS
jgi:hypothetical protein